MGWECSYSGLTRKAYIILVHIFGLQIGYEDNIKTDGRKTGCEDAVD